MAFALGPSKQKEVYKASYMFTEGHTESKTERVWVGAVGHNKRR